MSVFPMKFGNSAFWKAVILCHTKTFPYWKDPLSCNFGEISTLKPLPSGGKQLESKS